MEQAELINEQPNSVEFSVNAKGQYSGKCKVYAKTIEEAYAKALEVSAELEEQINEKNKPKGD